MNFNIRLNNLRKEMYKKHLRACLIWDPDNQYYLSGFRAISYSRPIMTLVTPEQTELIIPELEELHAIKQANVDHICVYYEQMDKMNREIHYKDHLTKRLKSLPANSRIGIEAAVLPSDVYTYIKEIGLIPINIGQKLIEMRSIKEEREIEYLKTAGSLSDEAIEASLKHARSGISELEFDSYGDKRLLEIASEKFANERIGYEDWTCSGVKRSTMPHLYSSTRKFADGDVVIHSRQVWFNGYRAENERTFFIGNPTEKQKDLLKLAIEAQQVGMEMIRPGITAKEVDIATYKIFKKAGYGEYVNHRVGHGLGLSEHEEPHLRFDNDLVLREGMVYTIEPGIYVPGSGGYRHSDTVILTTNGSYSITQYPRDIDHLMF